MACLSSAEVDTEFKGKSSANGSLSLSSSLMLHAAEPSDNLAARAASFSSMSIALSWQAPTSSIAARPVEPTR
eukprot:3289811-Prymnesium_polylepis.1